MPRDEARTNRESSTRNRVEIRPSRNFNRLILVSVKARRSGFPRVAGRRSFERALSIVGAKQRESHVITTNYRFALREWRIKAWRNAGTGRCHTTRRIARYAPAHTPARASTRGGTRSRNGYYRVRARAIVRACEKRRKWRCKRGAAGSICKRERECMRAAFLPLIPYPPYASRTREEFSPRETSLRQIPSSYLVMFLPDIPSTDNNKYSDK